MLIDLEQIDPDRHNIRSDAHDADIAALAADIAGKGLLQPLVVYPTAAPDGPPRMKISAGHRRYYAVKSLGWPSVEATVITPPRTDLERLDLMASENLLRRQLNPIEEATYYKACVDAGRTQQQIADAVGVVQTRVSTYLSLLQLPADIQRRVADGTMRPTNAINTAKQRRIDHGTARADAGGQHNRGFIVPHFDGTHPQRPAAASHCAYLNHAPAVRIGGACGECWEWAILRAAGQSQQRTDGEAPPSDHTTPRQRERFADPRDILRRLKCVRCTTPAADRETRRCFIDRDGKRTAFDHHEYVMEVAADA